MYGDTGERMRRGRGKGRSGEREGRAEGRGRVKERGKRGIEYRGGESEEERKRGRGGRRREEKRGGEGMVGVKVEETGLYRGLEEGIRRGMRGDAVVRLAV